AQARPARHRRRGLKRPPLPSSGPSPVGDIVAAEGDRDSDDVVVELGVITRPHGVRGEVRVHPHNPDSELLSSVGVLLLLDSDPPRPRKVLSTRRGPKASLMRLEGVSTVEQAERCRGVPIGLRRADFPEPEDDEIYLIDLIDLEVRSGVARIGRVSDVYE